MQWCLFSCQKPFVNIQNIDRYFDHFAGLLDCTRRGLKEWRRGRGWWSILPQGLCLLLYLSFVLHLILFTMATTMTGWYLIQKALPVFSIQIKVIMHSASPTIHLCCFILPTCSLMMGDKDACNGYRLLQHRIHVWYHVGRTHTYPEHIGRQGVHSKATEYPLKVFREAHLSVTFIYTWSTTLAINIEQKKHSKWDPSKLAEHHLKMSAMYANYPEKT